MGTCYRIGRSMARLCFSVFAKWEVEGKEAIPPKGPLIVVSNHLSNADPPVLAASIFRQLNFMGKRSLFSNPIAAHLFRAVGVHPATREGADIEAIRWNLSILKEDKVIVLFPEGSRSWTGGMTRGHPGVAYIAVRSQAPILPVAITGTEKVKGFWRIAFPFCHMKVKVGEPFTLPVIEGKLGRPVLENLSDTIMQRVAILLPKEYRGYYASQETETRP